MEQFFSYINQMGAPVMMPILFTIIGLCIGLKFGKSMKSGLYVGVGFVGLGVITGLLTDFFPEPINKFSNVFDIDLHVFDMGWPAAAAVAYNTLVGALIIPVCLLINFLLLVTKCTRTVNIDLWNYWHFAFIGAVVYFVMGHSLAWGYFAAIICYIITLVMADRTAEKFQGYYSDLKGISIPQPFVQGFTPFAVAINWLLDKIPGFSKLNIDADGLKKKFGVLGEPIVLGVIVGALIGALAHINDFADMEAFRVAKESKLQESNPLAVLSMTDLWVKYIIKDILFLGVTMGAVMELIPRITKLFIDGLMPISDKTRELVSRKFKGKTIHIGMSPALVIGHPTTLVCSVLLIPVILVMAVILPGNQFLPVASLAGIFYVFPMILPYTKGNVVKTFIIGLIAIVIGLLFVTDMGKDFQSAANDVFANTGDKAAKIEEYKDKVTGKMVQYEAGALDFASSLFSWVIYKFTSVWKYFGAGILTLITFGMLLWNRHRIVAEEKANKQNQA